MRFWATKGASNRLPSVLVRLQKKGGIYRLIFRVSALSGQLSAFERTHARISASDGHKCIRTQKRTFERTAFRISPHM
jgi:hypothetical protein